MILKKDWIFPTPIFIVDNVLSNKDIDIIKEDIFKDKNISTKNNWQSNSFLHKNKKYNSLTQKITESIHNVLHNCEYDYDTFEITGMWSNVLKPGETHSPHTHSNNILSGVFYVESDEFANIHFMDPRPAANVFTPTIKFQNKENSARWFFPSKKNTLIIFPSWLSHFVPVNKSSKYRVSIAFNIMLRGKINIPESLQSSEF